MKSRLITLTLSLFLIPAMSIVAFGQHAHAGSTAQPVALESGLGDVDLRVSTTNAEAQKFFSQGMAYIYGFNHAEGIRSFKRAAELDPELAMAYWGISLALGSNYNLQAEAPQLKEAYANLQKAQSLAAKATEHERAYIDALSKRYSVDPETDREKLALAYRTAMSELMKRYPDDLDAATLYAESMMNLRPWRLWTIDGKPAEGTEEIVAVLEEVLRRNPNHPGANHYYIHAVEASPNADRALPSAMRLGKIAPKSGHLVHMPSHIYIRTGDYHEAAQSNVDAIVADRDFILRTGVRGVYPMMYYNHNIHFLASAHAMQGRFADSLKTARELEANVKPDLKGMPMLEMFMPYPLVSLIRFNKWDELLKTSKPENELKITTGYWHFGRGVAYAGKGQATEAEAEFKSLQSLKASIPADAGVGNSKVHDVLKIAELVLSGKIAYLRGDKTGAIGSLRQAVEAEKAIVYNEPPDWDLPSREILGGMLLLAGDNVEAEKVFRAELAMHRRNGRALFGLVESLKRQNKPAAQMVQREFEKAWQSADTKLSVEDLAGLKR
ncbi:MAG TPA: hypothetical protein VJM12_17485 [Pyrinomonadaceae bacterium]|nr:hypothetical protein [Pyrinomonadaceae bacterium]